MTNLKWRYTNDMGKTYLDALRHECLLTMSQIDNMSKSSWHFFRKLLNEFDFEARDVAVNRAFYKLWEILGEHPDSVPEKERIRTLHLAEAPGSFVQVISRRYPHASMVAVSKPPATYADVVVYGKTVPTFSPRVQELKNCEFRYVDLLKDPLMINDVEKYDFITADGGFDEQERYDAKEILHYNLILSEVLCILDKQKNGGGCVLKIFETFTETTLSILWLLCSHYESFSFIKPITSRPTNAEKYLVCKGFKGSRYIEKDLLSVANVPVTSSMTLQCDIKMPDEFLHCVLDKSTAFIRHQIDTINEVMGFIRETHRKGHNGYVNKRDFLDTKKRSFEEWKKKYGFENGG